VGWDTIDYAVRRLAAVSGAKGSPVTLQTKQVPTNQVWIVTGIGIACPSAKAPTVTLYDLDPATSPAPCGSTVAGNLDYSNGDNLILVGGSILYLVFSAVDDHKLVQARIQYEVKIQSEGTSPRALLT
jgi:hypothetical protein